MRSASAFLLLSVLAASARAEDAIDRALADLSSDDASKRDAAELAISDAGGAALERALATLKSTTDAEARARLEKLIPWLKIDASTEVFLRFSRDQWFAARENGEITGVEHRTAELSGKDRDRVWTFVEEAWLKGDGDQVLYARHRLLAKHDLNLTPHEAEYDRREPRGDHTIWKFGREGIAVDRLRRADDDAYDPWDDPDVMSAAGPNVKIEGQAAHALVLETDFERILERATCAGLTHLDLSLLQLQGRHGRVVDLKFEAGSAQSIEISGRKVAAREWTIELEGRKMPGGLMISAEHGCLRWNLGFDDNSIEASDERTCRASRLVRDEKPRDSAAPK